MHLAVQSIYDTLELSSPLASLEPLTGWPLADLYTLDQHRPGLIAALMAARPRRRQAVYASLAMGAMERPEGFAKLLGQNASWHGAIWLAMLGEVFVTARPEKIAEVAFSGHYDGLLAACGRAGLDPLERAAYPRLHTIFADPLERRRQRAISETPRLNDQKLRTLEIVPDCCLHTNVTVACRKPEDAEFLRTIIELALVHTLKSPVDVYKTLSDIGPTTSVTLLAERLLKTFVTTERQPDVSDIPGAEVSDTGEKMRAAALRFHNCLAIGKNLYGVVSGEVAFVVLEEPDVIVQLQSGQEAGWTVTGLYGPRNAPVAVSDRLRACVTMQEAGFAVMNSVARDADRERVATRLATGWFGFDVEAE